MKHQSKRYRIIKGVKMMNYCDLCFDDVTNAQVIAEAKKAFKLVRKVKHPAGFYQLFTSN